MIFTVLVTGGTGLLGKSLKRVLSNNETMDNYDFFFTDTGNCDLKNPEATFNLFNKIKPHIVVHTAARVGGLYENKDNNYDMLVDNLLINMNVLNACKKLNVSKIINILSTCVFGNGLKYPLNSKDIHSNIPDASNEGYSYSKRLLDTASRLLSNSIETQIINIIPTNCYGLDDNYSLKSGHVLPALVHKAILAKEQNTDFVIKGNGEAKRQFLYSDDLAKIILHFIENKHTEKFIRVIASPPEDTEISIVDLVKKISKYTDFKGKCFYDSFYSEGQLKKTVNDNDIQKYIPGFIFTDLDTGLKNVIYHFSKYRSVLRK